MEATFKKNHGNQKQKTLRPWWVVLRLAGTTPVRYSKWVSQMTKCAAWASAGLEAMTGAQKCSNTAGSAR